MSNEKRLIDLWTPTDEDADRGSASNEGRFFEMELTDALYRFDCPEAETLNAYQWRDLSGEQERTVQAHLTECTLCAAELADLHRFVSQSDDQEAPNVQQRGGLAYTFSGALTEVAEQVRWIVASLVPPLTAVEATGALRSADATAGQSTTLLYEAGEIDISLTTRAEASDALTLALQIFADQPIGIAQAVLSSHRPGQSPLTLPLSAEGSGAFHHVESGRYQLRLLTEDRVIVIPDLALN